MAKKRIPYILFWIYVIFLLTFNEYLAIYISKSVLRGIYVIFLIFLLISILIKNKYEIKIEKIDEAIYLYVFYSIFRFVIQVIFYDYSTIIFVSFLQTIIPIFTFFVAKEMSIEESKLVENILIYFVVVSVFVGLINPYLNILPNRGSFLGDLYAGTGNGRYVVRGYSLAGSALITGFISSLAIIMIALRTNGKRAGIIKIALMGILILGLFKSLSRGAIMMLVLSILCFLILIIRRKGMQINKRIFSGAVLLAFVGFIFLIAKLDSIIASDIYQRFFVVGFSTNENSNNLRIDDWITAIEQIKDYLVFGKGYGYTGVQANRLTTSAINSESYFLSILINGGVINLILFFNIIWKIIKQSKYIIYSLDKYRYYALVVGMLAWSVTYILLDSDLNAMIFWYAVGQLFAFMNENHKVNCEK